LQSKGYDGLVYENKAEGHGDAYVAFDASQIRQAGNLLQWLRAQAAQRNPSNVPAVAQ
jgi:hypothetical protein